MTRASSPALPAPSRSDQRTSTSRATSIASRGRRPGAVGARPTAGAPAVQEAAGAAARQRRRARALPSTRSGERNAVGSDRKTVSTSPFSRKWHRITPMSWGSTAHPSASSAAPRIDSDAARSGSTCDTVGFAAVRARCTCGSSLTGTCCPLFAPLPRHRSPPPRRGSAAPAQRVNQPFSADGSGPISPATSESSRDTTGNSASSSNSARAPGPACTPVIRQLPDHRPRRGRGQPPDRATPAPRRIEPRSPTRRGPCSNP